MSTENELVADFKCDESEESINVHDLLGQSDGVRDDERTLSSAVYAPPGYAIRLLPLTSNLQTQSTQADLGSVAPQDETHFKERVERTGRPVKITPYEVPRTQGSSRASTCDPQNSDSSRREPAMYAREGSTASQATPSRESDSCNSLEQMHEDSEDFICPVESRWPIPFVDSLLARERSFRQENDVKKFLGGFNLTAVPLQKLAQDVANGGDRVARAQMSLGLMHNSLIWRFVDKTSEARRQDVLRADEKGACEYFRQCVCPPVAPLEADKYRSFDGKLFKPDVKFSDIYAIFYANQQKSGPSVVVSTSKFWSQLAQCLFFACLKDRENFPRLSHSSTLQDLVQILPSRAEEADPDCQQDEKTFYQIAEFLLTLIGKKNPYDEDHWRSRIFGLLKAALRAGRRHTNPDAKRRPSEQLRSLSFYENLISATFDASLADDDGDSRTSSAM